MIRTHTKKEHKLQAEWRGPMWATNAKSHLFFDVKDINDECKVAVHAQRMIPYPVARRGKQASVEIRQQAQLYDTKYRLAHSIRVIWKKGREHEVLVKWMGFEQNDNETWEAFGNIKEYLRGVLEEFLHTSGDLNLKTEILDLYFKSEFHAYRILGTMQ